MNSVLGAINDDMANGDKQSEFLLNQLDQEFITATMFLADFKKINQYISIRKFINISS